MSQVFQDMLNVVLSSLIGRMLWDGHFVGQPAAVSCLENKISRLVSAACLGSSLQLLPRPLGYMLSTTKLDNVLFNFPLCYGQYVECVFLES